MAQDVRFYDEIVIFVDKMNSNAKALILNASAGSGKTYRLAYKYILDVLGDQPDAVGGGFNQHAYRHILAVTFTNKATEEMKSRILNQIHLLAIGKPSSYLKKLIEETGLSEKVLRERALRVRRAILHDYSRFSILTNDTFFQRILRAFVKELGVEMNYSIELDTAPIITKSVDALLESIDSNADLQRWVHDMAQDRIEAGERWDIREGIMRLQRELFKENTKGPIERIKDKEELKRIVFRYTTKADQQIEALRELARQASAAISEAGYSHSDFSRSFTTYFDRIATGDTKAPTPTVLAHAYDLPEQWFAKNKRTPQLIALAERLQPMMARIVEIHTLANSRNLLLQNYRSFALLNDLYRKSVEICKEENTMLLSETKHTIAEFVTESDAPFIYEKVGTRFERYMIDEFQDTSFKEWKNFLPLLRNAMSQSANTAVLLVGDIKQSIYRWRGGDWKILGKIAPEDISQGGIEYATEPLNDNYRSLHRIVEFNRDIFDKLVADDNTRLNTMLDSALERSLISQQKHQQLYNTIANAYASHGQTAKRESLHEGYVAVTVYDDEPDIVGCVKSVIDQGYKPCDITILIRRKRESYAIAQQLLAAGSEDERYRFDITTQEALSLNNSYAISFILAVMRLAANRNDSISLAIYNRYQNACRFDATLSDEEVAFLDTLRVSSPEEAFEKILIRYNSILAPHTAYIQALHEHVAKFSTTRVADLGLFLRWWEENGEGKSVGVERNERAIEIMTIHKAKGLENKVVIIPHCDWSLKPATDSGRIQNTVWATPSQKSGIADLDKFPISFNSTVEESIFSEAFYEESVYSHVDALNLLYVAFTRAGEQLHIFVPKKGDSAKTNASTVGALLHNALDLSSGKYEYGTFDTPEPECDKGKNDSQRGENKVVRLNDYPSSEVVQRLSTDEARYFDDVLSGRLSPRDEGILLHKILEKAETRDDIAKAGEEAVANGLLSEQEWQRLLHTITQTLDSTIAGEWFDGKWTTIRSEAGIISLNDGIKRPDRVMISDERTVVIDYKFGERSRTHRKQIGQYIALLREMGYKNISGYVWYIREQHIAKYDPADFADEK
ncbi:MAG: UvrD-helicase domain-containing protein [Alistipes sp.]|nr:UvrD-helicase domain-containing protein [Alistipes sp.]